MNTTLTIDLQSTFNSIQSEVIDINNDIEVLGTSVESLQDLTKLNTILNNVSIFKDSIATEDISKMSNVFIDIIYNKLGYKKDYRISKEDNSMTTAVKGIRDTINNVWEAIKQFFIRMSVTSP